MGSSISYSFESPRSEYEIINCNQYNSMSSVYTYDHRLFQWLVGGASSLRNSITQSSSSKIPHSGHWSMYGQRETRSTMKPVSCSSFARLPTDVSQQQLKPMGIASFGEVRPPGTSTKAENGSTSVSRSVVLGPIIPRILCAPRSTAGNQCYRVRANKTVDNNGKHANNNGKHANNKGTQQLTGSANRRKPWRQ